MLSTRLPECTKNRGFQIKHIDADVQFECTQDEIEGVEIDIVDADDYTEEVERAMRAVEEGIRGLVQGVLFRRMPRLMVRRLVEVSTRNLNSFLAENGTSDTLSPLTIVIGGTPPDDRSCPLDFSACTEIFEDNG